VFDILGNEVTVLDEGERKEGQHTVEWNGKDKFQREVNSGVYLIQLATPNYKKTIKGIMLK
jgi:flagellar hook assembly protein FlgD